MNMKEESHAGEKFLNRLGGLNASIRDHLEPSYRKQYNIRRFLLSVFLYALIISIMIEGSGNSFLSPRGLFALVWCFLAWRFWHYAYWSFQGGFIHNFVTNLIHFGSIGALIWKIFVQNFLIMIWITLIAPLSGIKTWLKAVKHDKILYVENQRHDVWQ